MPTVPTSSATAVPTATVTDASGAPTAPPTTRRTYPPPPNPTDAQLRDFGVFRDEVKAFGDAGTEFQEAISTIVKYHFEKEKRRILSGLDQEIGIEKDALKAARKEAIERLRAFVNKYSGPNALPEYTPDAMFRLAALLDEQARDLPPEQLADNLVEVIALYKQIVIQFPNYREIAAVYYYLGHMLNDSARLREAQQVWRSLVCHNHFAYPVPTDPTNPGKDLIVPKTQDHNDKYWMAWTGIHSIPIDRDPEGQKLAKAGAKGAKGGALPKHPPPRAPKRGKPNEPPSLTVENFDQPEPTSWEEDTVYEEIYPEDCTPLPQKVAPGQEPQYLKDTWYQIGEHHFDYLDSGGGPFNWNRAVSAYKHSLASIQDRSHSIQYLVSLYKLAWTYYKQQRYEAAVKTFVQVLQFTDEYEKNTGSASLEFRKEAAQYIAGSLLFEDFVGGPENEPFVYRDDFLEKYSNPVTQEQKSHVGVDRVQDATLIPQDQKWTFDIYKALASEYQDMSFLANKTDVLELMLAKFPMNRDAPKIQDDLARTYDERSRYAKDGSPDQALFASKALKARSDLSKYVGDTPWVNANKDDPEAIQTAERLVKGGLKQAAVQHTNLARQWMAAGNQTTDAAERKSDYSRALDEYKLAEQGWNGYIQQDPNALDVYESKFWLADSRYWQIALMVDLEILVPPELYASAKAACTEVRDSNEDDKYLEPSAQYVVSMADKALDEQYRLNQQSNGAQGFPKVENLNLTGSGTSEQYTQTPMPVQMQDAITARDDYRSRVPADKDPLKNRPLFEYQAAEDYFLYGDFAHAKPRLETIYKDQCQKTKYGFLAWQKLLTMANIKADQTGDTADSRKLAQDGQDPKTSCAIDDAQKAEGEAVINPTLQGGYYKDAANAFKKAQDMPDGPDRVKQWKVAGQLYEDALKAAPDRDEAPEAAINGAYAYKQIGNYDKAIEMYQLFISKYGDDSVLTKLEKGSADDQKKYQERLKYLNQAYTDLSNAYILFFNYQAAAETYEKIANIKRFPLDQRKQAARNALVLYSNLNNRSKMMAMHDLYLSFKPSSSETAEADYLVAQTDYKQWDDSGSDSGANHEARVRATDSLKAFFDKYKSKREAAQYNVNAAYSLMKMYQSVNQKSTSLDWAKSTVKAFETYRSANSEKALGSPEADMAAECDFDQIDHELKQKFDYDTGHQHYKGTTVEVIKQYDAAAKQAEGYYKQLSRFTDAKVYGSAKYLVAAYSRQGSLYDSLRTGLFNTREPALKLFSSQEQALINQLMNSNNDDAVNKALVFQDNRTKQWRAKRDQELASADEIMVREYVHSVMYAKKFNVRSKALSRALQRLAYFTDLMGDAQLGQYASKVEGFTYSPGMFQKTRPGMDLEPTINPLPEPLPVLVP